MLEDLVYYCYFCNKLFKDTEGYKLSGIPSENPLYVCKSCFDKKNKEEVE